MEKLYAACSQLPPDLQSIERILNDGNYAPNLLSDILYRFVMKRCFFEVSDFIDEHSRLPEKHEVHSAYVYDLTKLFLKFGLDPNFINNNDGFAHWLEIADYGYISADTMRLLLEHGLDPNIQYESESLFEELDSNVIIDVSLGLIEDDDSDNKHEGGWRIYDIRFHLWLVLMGFGAKLNTGNPPLTMTKDQPLTIFRQHERFDFRIEYTKEVRDGWIMHIFDRNTGEEVATL